jgi:transposase
VHSTCGASLERVETVEAKRTDESPAATTAPTRSRMPPEPLSGLHCLDLGENFQERLTHFLGRASPLKRHRTVGLALGGEAGARLCQRLAFPTSPDTILRRVKDEAPQPSPTPRVLGIDDFAFRKGHTYGTILVDLERSRVVDLLPDRTADTLAAWLRGRSGIEVISRDRASAYSQAATNAAPNAVQVADRFHLLVNLREVVERLIQKQAGSIRSAFAPPTESPENRDSVVPPRSQSASPDRRQAIFEHVRTLHREGMPLRRIARELRLHYRTVVRYVRSDRCPDWNPGHPRSSELDRHADFIRGRLHGGCRSAAQIGRELRADGYRGAASVVRDYVRKLRATMGLSPARPSRPLVMARPVPPSARRLSVAVVRRAEQRTAQEREWLGRLKGLNAETHTAIDLAEDFASLVRDRRVAGLDDWLTRAETISVFRPFVQGLRRDEAAVRAGLGLPWSNGPVEGAINRLKLIKRSAYGRSGFALLKARVLNTM